MHCTFQISMASSTMYHTFSCKSEKHFNCFLSFDLFGIALSLLAIYLSGIYYAFWCHPVSTRNTCFVFELYAYRLQNNRVVDDGNERIGGNIRSPYFAFLNLIVTIRCKCLVRCCFEIFLKIDKLLAYEKTKAYIVVHKIKNLKD